MERNSKNENESNPFEIIDDDIEMKNENELPPGQFNLCGDIVQLYHPDCEMEEESKSQSSFDYNHKDDYSDNPFSVIVNSNFEEESDVSNNERKEDTKSKKRPVNPQDDFDIKGFKKKQKEDELAEAETCISSELDEDEIMECEEDDEIPWLNNNPEEIKEKINNNDLKYCNQAYESTCDEEDYYEQCLFSNMSSINEEELECECNVEESKEELKEIDLNKNYCEANKFLDSDHTGAISSDIFRRKYDNESIEKEQCEFRKMMDKIDYQDKVNCFNREKYYFINNSYCSGYSNHDKYSYTSEQDLIQLEEIKIKSCLNSDHLIGCISHKIILEDEINELKINNFNCQSIRINDNENSAIQK